LSGVRTVAAQHADEVAQLGGELANERAAKAKLRREVADVSSNLAAERVATRKVKAELADVSGSLAAERLASKQLKAKIKDPLESVVVYRGKKVALRQAVVSTSNRISKRAVVTSSREVGSMAGEALPYIGVAVIVGVTALELKDLCDTLKDMSELKRAMSLDTEIDNDERTVCSLKTPTQQELWEAAKSSPDKAWSAARDAIPTLEEIKAMELPEIDWEQTWSSAASKSNDAWEATKAGAAAAADISKSTGARAWDNLFGSDDESDLAEP